MSTNSNQPTSSPGRKKSPVPKAINNPLKSLMAHGKMPVVLELHLTASDKVGYQELRQRYLADAMALPKLTLLGQYLRQLDVFRSDLSPRERALATKLQAYADLSGSGRVDLIALDDAARGRDTLDNAVAAELLAGLGVDPARLIVNMVARNRFPDQIRSRLIHFSELGVLNALLLTGDLPVEAGKRAVFPMDSVGMCALAQEMVLQGDLPDEFLIAAAGHPNIDADPDGLKMLQKALAGARVIMTQAIYDVDAFSAWMDRLHSLGVLDMVHVLAEVIPVTSSRQLEIIAEVPGMRVPAELVETLRAAQQRIETTGQSAGHPPAWIKQRHKQEGARLTRTLLHRIRHIAGVRGFYLGCVASFEPHLELLKETPLLPVDRGTPPRLTKLSGSGRQRVLAQIPAMEQFLDGLIARARSSGSGWWRRVAGAAAQLAWVRAGLKVLEWPKVPVFGCRGCDQCDLSPDALICPRGCAKQMSHGPCGAPRLVDDRYLCEDTSRECTWIRIRQRRDDIGIAVADRLAIRTAPHPDFFNGTRFSALAGVLAGTKDMPQLGVVVRAPLAAMLRRVRGRPRRPADAQPIDLIALVRAKKEQLQSLIADRPEMHREELLIKALALVQTPEALHLIEGRMAQLGIPAEGTLSDLSLRELFLVAHAVPVVRERIEREQHDAAAPISPLARCDELLAILPRGKQLRRAMRRELASGLIQHIASLGVPVTFTEALLQRPSVEPFLQVLSALRDELPMARSLLRLDQRRLTIHIDRVHYKSHFRSPVALRRSCHADAVASGDAGPDAWEMAIDIKQFDGVGPFKARLRAALNELATPDEPHGDRIWLEPCAGESQSICWAFNQEFWHRLHDFEQATGINYDASIGGSTDHNLDYVRSTARAYFDRVHDHDLGGQRLYVAEIGVAAVVRATTFLDEYKRICEVAGTDSYRNTVYVLADYSQEILERGRAQLAKTHPHVEAVRIDAADPTSAFERYTGRIMHIHLCNVYDNLPTDKVAWLSERLFLMQSRAYVAGDVPTVLMAKYGLDPTDVEPFRARLQSLDGGSPRVGALLDWIRDRMVAAGQPPEHYVHLWMDLFAAMAFEERYVAMDADAYARGLGIPEHAHIAESLTELFRGRGDVRVHVNQHALAGFVKLLDVLHDHGSLEVVDLFVQRIDEYEHRHKGPAKYDGSTVNWLNGPLFRAVAERMGFEVRFNSFKPFDPKSASVTMLASRGTPA